MKLVHLAWKIPARAQTRFSVSLCSLPFYKNIVLENIKVDVNITVCRRMLLNQREQCANLQI